MIEPCGHRLTIKPAKLTDIDETLAKANNIPGFQIVSDNGTKRAEQAVDQGTVLSVGFSAFKDFGTDPWCNVGDTVAYARHAGMYVKDPDTGDEILVVNDQDVVAIIKRSA